MDKERLLDYFTPEFADAVLGELPAPVSPVTGQPMWEKGIRLHGNQRNFVIDNYRWKKADGGIRFGKSFGPAVMIFLDTLWRWQMRGIYNDRYAVIGSTYEMATEEMNHLHHLLDDAGIPHNFHTPKDSSWEISAPGLEWRVVTLTSSDITRIAAKPYRGIVIAEGAQQDEEVFAKAQGRVSQTRGWVIMSGTFEKQKGRWYARLTTAWQRGDGEGVVYTCPSWENPLVYPGGRNDPEIVARATKMSRPAFLEMYAGVPQAASDLVLPEADPEYILRHRYPRQRTSFDPELPVYLAVDPGISHAYAVLAIQIGWSDEYQERFAEFKARNMAFGMLGRSSGNILWVVDGIYRHNRETELVVKEALNRKWARNVSGAVMDVAARQRRAEGSPVIKQWAQGWRAGTGKGLPIVANRVPLNDGYQVHRAALRNAWPEDDAQATFNYDKELPSVVDPAGIRLQIDPSCEAIFFGGMVDGSEYGGEYYLHKNRVDGAGSIVRDEPVDQDNDAIKALNYFAYEWAGESRNKHLYASRYHQEYELVS